MNFGLFARSFFFPVRVSTTIALSGIILASFAPGEAWAQYTNISVGLGGAQPNGLSEYPTLSDDARFVAFSSVGARGSAATEM